MPFFIQAAHCYLSSIFLRQGLFITARYRRFLFGEGCLPRLFAANFSPIGAVAYCYSISPISLQRGLLLIVALYRQFLSDEGRCLLRLVIVDFSPVSISFQWGPLLIVALYRQFLSNEGRCLLRLVIVDFSPVSISFQWGPFLNRPRRFMPHPARRDITAAIGKMRLDRLLPSSTRSSE